MIISNPNFVSGTYGFLKQAIPIYGDLKISRFDQKIIETQVINVLV